MNITASITERREVEISDHDAAVIAARVIRARFDIPAAEFVRIDDEGNLVREDRRGGGSRSWFEPTVVRRATDEDRAALAVLARLPAY